jgi:hypothetical protein
MHRGIFWSVTKNFRTHALQTDKPQQLKGTCLCVEALKETAQIEQSAIGV